MKKIVFILSCIILSNIQGQDKGIVSTPYSVGSWAKGIQIDSNGNLYVAGKYTIHKILEIF